MALVDTPAKPAAHGASHDGENLVERRTLRDYYIILRERLWIALPIALLVAVPMGYFKARQTPMYLSVATMQFEKPETVVTSQVVIDPTVRNDIELNTNIQILNSARLRTKVIESFTPDEVNLLQKPFLKNLSPGLPVPSVGACLGSISVEPTRNSLLISITVRHPDPQAAALVANRYVSQFMTYLFEHVGGINESAVEFLNTRAEQLRKESEESDQKLQAYMKSHNLVSLDKSKDIVGERLKTISSTLTNAQLVRLGFENQYNLVESYKRDGRNLVEIQYIAGHGSVPTLNAQLASLLQSQTVLSERYLEMHPKMIDLANGIAVVREQLAKAIDLAVADLATRLNESRESERSLQLEFAKAEKESLQLGEFAVEYKSLENQALVAKTNYLQILDRLNQTKTTKSLEKIPLHPLDPAVPSSTPYSPNLPAILRSCTGVGVLVFLGVAIGLSFVDDRIKSAWDVESFIGANLLGIIPDLSSVKDDEKYSMLIGNQQTPGVEAFLSVYSSVKIHSKLDFPKSILVTSTIPGEGKTLISCNLAASFARHGKRTLLIDCDLRRPMLHHVVRFWRFARERSHEQPGAGDSQDLRQSLSALFRRAFQNSDGDSREPHLRPAARTPEARLRSARYRFATARRGDRQPADCGTDGRSGLRLPIQPRVPKAHPALHEGAPKRQKRGSRRRAQRSFAAPDRVLLELPLLP